MYTLLKTKKFCKSVKRVSNLPGGVKIISELNDFLLILQLNEKIPLKYRDHSLKGEYIGYRECHIRGDVLLLYRIEENNMILIAIEIGSHSYLF